MLEIDYQARRNLYYGNPGRAVVDGVAKVATPVYTRTPDVDSYGDAEGSCFMVFEVDGVNYRVDGYYSSYDGLELDGTPFEVTPTVKTITSWE